MRHLPAVALREAMHTMRTALFPLHRLSPLPPAGQRPVPHVVLVHGFLAHPDMMRPLARHLLSEGWPHVERFSYPSVGLDLPTIVARLAAVVERQGAPVDLVGHSLGAVVCRAFLKAYGGAPLVRRFVSLGGPHHGTALYRFVPGALRPVFDPEGPWVQRLAEGPEPVPTTVVRARWDHQVLPPIRARIAEAVEHELPGTGHNGLLWSREAHKLVARTLAAP